MPFPHSVYKTQRIVPLRFERGVTGQPLIQFPDLDNRGWFRPDPAGKRFLFVVAANNVDGGCGATVLKYAPTLP